MNLEPRQHLHGYLRRRSPWGPPWWIYGAAFGAANVIRQGAIIVTPSEVPQSIRVASWAATALLVIAVINGVAVLRGRRTDATTPHQQTPLVPTWPLRRRSHSVGEQPSPKEQSEPKEDT